jgi:hypothetical protein
MVRLSASPIAFLDVWHASLAPLLLNAIKHSLIVKQLEKT